MKNKGDSVDTQVLTNGSTTSRVCRWAIVLLWMLGIWYLSDQPDLQSGLAHDFILRKIAHLIEFGGLFCLVNWALRQRFLLVPIVWALAYAAIDEWHQTWVAGRSGSVRDVAIDALGIAVALVFISAIKKPTTTPVPEGHIH